MSPFGKRQHATSRFPASPRPPQPRNPLHGLALEAIVTVLPWAREKVEGLYLFMLREQRRNRVGGERET